jgi:hypothetical protein
MKRSMKRKCHLSATQSCFLWTKCEDDRVARISDARHFVVIRTSRSCVLSAESQTYDAQVIKSRDDFRVALTIAVVVTSLTLGMGYALPAFAASSYPSQLVFAKAPSSTANSGSPLESQPVIDIEDGAGNVDASASGSVSASIQPSPQGTTLVNATANVVNGVATFNNLTIDALSNSYTLVFTYDSLSISSSPVVVTGDICAGCAPFIPVRSYSPTFGPFATGSSQLGHVVITQLQRLIKWTQRDMRPGFSSVAQLVVRVYGYAEVNETSAPEKLALERAEAVETWIIPRIRNLDRTSMPLRFLVSRDDIRSSSALSHKVKVRLTLND